MWFSLSLQPVNATGIVSVFQIAASAFNRVGTWLMDHIVINVSLVIMAVHSTEQRVNVCNFLFTCHDISCPVTTEWERKREKEPIECDTCAWLLQLAPATIKARNAQAKPANVFARPKALLAITANVVTCPVFITEILRIKDLVFVSR